jgi:hypothetical protein
MAAFVAQLKGSKSTAIDTAHRFSRTNATLADLDLRSFQNHMAARLLWFADALSRNKIVELNSVCQHTLHIRHKNIGLNEQVRDFIGGLEVEMLFSFANLGKALPSPANASAGTIVRFSNVAGKRRRASAGIALGSLLVASSWSTVIILRISADAVTCGLIAPTPHPLGNFLPMKDEAQRDDVCRGFDDVWHGRVTVDEAAAAAGVRLAGLSVQATVVGGGAAPGCRSDRAHSREK